MPTATNDDVELYYETDGPSDAETVVFVEGLGYGAWMWGWQQPAVADGFETVVWDNRGTGRSSTPEGPYTVSEMAADLEAVLADHGVRRAHVVGASMGGMIAQQYALEYDRARSLSLLCTTPGGEAAVDVPEETAERMFATPEGADERELLRHRMAPALTDEFREENPDVIEGILDWRLAGDADEAGRAAQAAAVETFDASDRLHEITNPALVLHGIDDRVVPVENGRLLAEGLPKAELGLYEGGPHLFFIERSRLVNDDLVAFFEEHGEPAY
jgi:pimeloyl-ACP methyl ester carboxylesterase